MKAKLQQFMMGRYGVDDLSKFSLYLLIGLMIINLFLKSSLVSFLLLAGLVWVYFRMFSKNYDRRYAENTRFLELKDRAGGFLRKEKNIAGQKKIYRIYTCPGCKQKIRVPKGKGKIEVTCPKCHTSFVKKS